LHLGSALHFHLPWKRRGEARCYLPGGLCAVGMEDGVCMPAFCAYWATVHLFFCQLYTWCCIMFLPVCTIHYLLPACLELLFLCSVLEFLLPAYSHLYLYAVWFLHLGY
jgi:hypothetical protein